MRRLTLFAFLIISFNGFSINIDSLYQSMEKTQPDTQKISTLIDIAHHYSLNHNDSSELLIDSVYRWSREKGYIHHLAKSVHLSGTHWWRQQQLKRALDSILVAREISISVSDENMIAKSASNAAILYSQFGMPDSAEVLFREAENYYSGLQDSSALAKLDMDIGGFYNRQGKSELSIERFYNSLRYYEHNKDSFNLVYIYSNIATTYTRLGAHEDAETFFRKSVAYDLLVEEVSLIIQSYLSLGLLYSNTHEIDSAIHYFNLAKERMEENKNDYELFAYYINLGHLYFQIKEYNKALNLFLAAKRSPILEHMQLYKAIVLIDLGLSYTSLDQLDSARTYAEMGLAKALEVNSLEHISVSYHSLSELDSIEGNYQGALENYRLYRNYRDSVNSHEGRYKITQLELEYQTEKQTLENQLLKEQATNQKEFIRLQQIIGGSTLFSLILLSILFIIALQGKKRIKIKNQLLEEQKKELEQLNITKDKFFSIVAHDLKSPFTSLLGFIEILKADYGRLTDHERDEIISNLDLTANNTFNLLTNLLEWARTQRGNISFSPERFHPSDKIKNVVEALRLRTIKKQHFLQLEMNTELTINSDPNLFQAILINLTNNAIKFTPERGTIKISLSEEEKYVKVCVIDSGVGIPDKELNSLFQIENKFQRNGTNGEEGTGLGLLLCYEFANLAGAKLDVVSELGKGSTFCLSIPKDCNTPINKSD
jgi:signal transduction histidine kinase